MIGAIIGDIVGSSFEFNNCKDKNFELFRVGSRMTDDSYMTLAVAKAIIESYPKYDSLLFDNTVKYMRSLGNKYPLAGYGGMFADWLKSKNPLPYNSFGNGSAMRVSPCGFKACNLDEALHLAEITAQTTHSHPEGIKGAKAVAAAVFLARTGSSLKKIEKYINESFYKIDFTLDDIRSTYKFSSDCRKSVPQALQSFFESNNFEDAIRNAISIGGDSDTIAAIAGAIAEAYWGIPKKFEKKALTYMDNFTKEVFFEFEKTLV